MLRLPDSLRDAFKEPFGPVYTETEALLTAVDETAAEPETATSDAALVAVGDMVTYHLLEAGRQPDVAVIDGKTEREAVDEAIADALADPDGLTNRVSNPPAELSEAMLVALREAIAAAEPVTIIVDGEEDLATLPAILAAPRGSSVIYGQPGAGMVQVAVTEPQTDEARRLLGEFDGDTAAALDIIGG
ncbi:MAG: GTP-dependent dephospho-CoA kinase family protein [Euryarchaeota archaeon]|nr:GTP-dependent dephospho-CoA kinase family protein [Euryarchaeota archaeon]